MKRKDFIKSSSLAIGSISLANQFSFASQAVIGSNERIRIGAIGINGMGWSDTISLLKIGGVELVAICDVDQNVIEKRKNELGSKGKKVRTYSDYRD